MADEVTEPDELIGSTVGKYEIVGKIGHGGMGRVYEALNPTLGKRVALKLLDPELAKNASAAARFRREARAASAASSPHIVEMFDADISDDGSPYIVMELLDGEALSDTLAREGVLDPAEATRIAVQLLRGLAKAHEAGIVHRDLKPDNVFMEHRDHEPPFVKILDFGVSKVQEQHAGTTLTREGSVVGTPAYMSPEQAQGETDVDARSDIWSVGAILYECLTGKLPFEGTTYEQMIVRICTAKLPPLRSIAPDVPEDLATTVESCLQRERRDRPAGARELMALLDPSAPRASSPRASTSKAKTRAIRVDAKSAIGTDSTVEAPGVLLASQGAGPSLWATSRRSTLFVALGVVAACIALVAWSLTRAESRSATPAPAEDTVAPTATEATTATELGTSEGDAEAAAREADEATTADPEDSEDAADLAEALPSATATAAAEVVTKPPPAVPRPPVAVAPKPPKPPATPKPPTEPPPTLPPEPERKPGVAGGIDIQKN